MAAIGWPVPDHVFEVTEAYGDIAWLGWMLQPSIFAAHGREALANRISLLNVAPGKNSLVAFTDPEESLLFVDDDGTISVASSSEVVKTQRTLAEVSSALGSTARRHVHCGRVSGGETQQDRIYVDELELELFYDSYNRRGDTEQIHLQFYVDRKPEVKALVERALAAAGMRLVRVDGPRNATAW